jgi:hypothetical protein
MYFSAVKLYTFSFNFKNIFYLLLLLIILKVEYHFKKYTIPIFTDILHLSFYAKKLFTITKIPNQLYNTQIKHINRQNTHYPKSSALREQSIFDFGIVFFS